MNNTGFIGLNCDVCGRTVQGYTFVNGMKFCAKCYQETFGNNYSQTYIINAQYTEHLLKENAQLKEKFENLKQENKQLERQLAEKDKKINQACDKIRKEMRDKIVNSDWLFGWREYSFILELLDQIEGENNV